MLSASLDADNSDVDDAFRFDAMSPVKSEDGTTSVPPELHEDQKQGQIVENANGSQRRYSCNNFLIPFNEISLNSLETLRTDLTIDLRNSTDEVELSLAVTGIEILLSVLERCGTKVFFDQLNTLASEMTDTALINDIDGAGKIPLALTRDNIMDTAIRLQELCDDRLKTLDAFSADNTFLGETKKDDRIAEDSFTFMNSAIEGDSYYREVEDVTIHDLESSETLESANVVQDQSFQRRSLRVDTTGKSNNGEKIGIDNHEPAQYPLPGQWESKHYRRESLDATRAKSRDAWVGMNMAQHRHHIQQYMGTCDGIPIARWAGSLRDNARYANRVKGVKPMRFSKTLGADGRSILGSRRNKGVPIETKKAFADASVNDLKSAYSEMINDPDMDTKAIEKKVRERKSRLNRIMKMSNNTKLLLEQEHNYPKPGETHSKYFNEHSADAIRARQRPYVGMNMNDVRMHITTGHGDGKAASHWVGGLRSNANGAMEATSRKKKSSSESGSTDNFVKKIRTSDKISTSNKEQQYKIRKKSSEMRNKTGRDYSSQYIGNKTAALMSGVPQSMRRYKINLTNGLTSSPSKAYNLLANALATPLLNEHAMKFRFRDDTPYTSTRLHIKASDEKFKKREIKTRRRRNMYGEQAAARFKKLKEKKKKNISKKLDIDEKDKL